MYNILGLSKTVCDCIKTYLIADRCFIQSLPPFHMEEKRKKIMSKLQMLVVVVVLMFQPQHVFAHSVHSESIQSGLPFANCRTNQTASGASVCVKFQLRTPLLFLVSAGEESVTLSWGQVRYAQEYLIFRVEPEGYRMIGRVPYKVRFFVDKGAECGHRYTYALFARNYGKSSKMSNLVNATTAPCQ